ncbi:MAG: DUF1501 domain-containing protein [Planctomycetaceae bacterium]
MANPSGRRSTPWEFSRREMLQHISLGGLGVSLPGLLRAESTHSAATKSTADHLIVVFLDGGPSHLDTWDMKLDAPAEIRGEFQPIPSSLPGVPVCELLPNLAPHMHRCALIRSAHHTVNNAHASAVYTSLTGHDRGEFSFGGGTSSQDYPAIGSITSVARPPERPIVPFVSLPYITKEGAGGPPQPGFFAGLLGKSRDPLFVLNDPNSPNFTIPELTLASDVNSSRLNQRRSLQNQLDQHLGAQASRSVSGVTGFQEQAFNLLNSTATQEAFQLSQESDGVRQRYGRNIYGQSVLLARRLIEAGTRVVTISWAPDANATWDTHGQNFKRLRGDLLPQLDLAVSSLFQDLVERGLFERTLVVVMGEFGRTPKINANAGRDHWNFCYSVLMAGGGIQGGALHGASDKTGAFPAADPVSPADIVATIYQCLGLSPQYEFYDLLKRPFRLVPWGEPLAGILA